jgi:hypothetical protein
MSTYRVLRRLLIWDIKLQARENVYLFTLFTDMGKRVLD